MGKPEPPRTLHSKWYLSIMGKNERQDRHKVLLADAARVRQGTLRLARRLQAERSSSALSGNKLSVLAYLHIHGRATAGEIVAAEHQQPQSFTRVFAELETEKLISRTPDEHDRRQSVLTITTAGLNALSRDMSERDQWLASALTGLSGTERGVLQLAGNLMEQLAGINLDQNSNLNKK